MASPQDPLIEPMKKGEANSRPNLRPMLIMVALSYVLSTDHLVPNVSTSMSTDGKKKITDSDVEESPAWNGSSQRDVARVPEQVKIVRNAKHWWRKGETQCVI